MHRFWMPALLAAVALICAKGQQPGPVAQPATAPQPVKVYKAGHGVQAPVLKPLELGKLAKEKCGRRAAGKVEFSLLVDEKGIPRNIFFLKPLGTELDRFALEVAEVDKFTPGMFEGKPVVVAEELEVEVSTSVEQQGWRNGKQAELYTARALPKQSLKTPKETPDEAVLTPDVVTWKVPRPSPRPQYFPPDVSQPVLIYTVDASYTKAAERARVSGRCLLSLIVDPHGLPENIQVVHGLKHGLDRSAMAAVERYRFIPAMRDGEPVPAAVTVHIDFRPPEIHFDVDPEFNVPN